jgi:hypothetical protein
VSGFEVKKKTRGTWAEELYCNTRLSTPEVGWYCDLGSPVRAVTLTVVLLSVVFNTPARAYPSRTVTKDSARYTPGTSSFRSTNPSVRALPEFTGTLTITSDLGFSPVCCRSGLQEA